MPSQKYCAGCVEYKDSYKFYCPKCGLYLVQDDKTKQVTRPINCLVGEYKKEVD